MRVTPCVKYERGQKKEKVKQMGRQNVYNIKLRVRLLSRARISCDRHYKALRVISLTVIEIRNEDRTSARVNRSFRFDSIFAVRFVAYTGKYVGEGMRDMWGMGL